MPHFKPLKIQKPIEINHPPPLRYSTVIGSSNVNVNCIIASTQYIQNKNSNKERTA